jgi:hypothetical protein
LLASHAESDANTCLDPFFADPEFNVQDRAVSSHRDPFAEDPGFGLEFDLLQRTVSFVVETNKIVADPFSADPSIDPKEELKTNLKETPGLSASAYDIFAGDPPLTD